MLTPANVRQAIAAAPPSSVDLRVILGPDTRDAAVLVPLSFEGQWPCVHLLVRSKGLRDHAGEVGFPGGKVEPGEGLLTTVYREIEEEIGLAAAELELLGQLYKAPVITGRYLIHPFVAAIAQKPRITSTEHAISYEVSLGRWLGDKAEVIEATEGSWRGAKVRVPHFRIGDHVMYGASAVILFDLLSRLAVKPLETIVVADKPWGDRYLHHERALAKKLAQS